MLKEVNMSITADETTVMSHVSVSTVNRETKTGLTFQMQMTLTFYVFTLTFCLFSNIILNYLIFTRKYMRKYIFTASISISHIIICTTVIPLAISVQVTKDGAMHAQKVACDVILCFCLGVTSYSMLTQAIRRRLAISERFRNANFTYRGKVKNIAFIWSFALVTSLAYIFKQNVIIVFSFISNGGNVFMTNISAESKNDVTFDDETFGNTSYILRMLPNVTESAPRFSSSYLSVAGGFYVYNMVLLFLQMIIPCTAALVLQTVTLFGLKRRPNQIHWVKEILITKQHISMAAVFLVCWLPLMLANITVGHTLVPELVFHILQPFAVSSIIYFPIIYYALNAHIKREFLLLIQNMIR